MKPKLAHVAAAAALGGFLGFGGMSLAYAQDSGTEDGSTTTEPEASTPDSSTPDGGTENREGCPEKDGARDGSSSTEGSSA
jgi:hypothetical protein